ncbi:hypothetical protein PoB_000870900 [Plakobranchus ocellatus]|uniref:Uncharacterized protein n=1 Tax=Plakobranchus ocellatus TaxID=259542 RepID=A0AAV3YIU8_9GAST|nr:hypothetical protein PoB_000870900 [Plakobranchus ocellatus]
MNNFDDSYDDVQIVVDGRRKRANKAEHSREKLKHSCGGKIPQISCQHDTSKSQRWAEYLTGADLSLNQDRFYGAGSKPVKREQVTEEDRKKTRGHSVEYYLLAHQDRIKTCKATFCSILATDVCSTCTQFRSRVQDTSMTEVERKVMAAEFILHRKRARQFYNLLNEVKDTITVCFDVMENLDLPRTPFL